MDQHQIYLEWMLRGLKKPGKTQKGLARALNRDPMAASRLVNRKRKFQLVDLPKISSYIDEPIPQLSAGLSSKRKTALTSVSIVGRIGASVWQDGRTDLGIVAAYTDPRFPAADQCAFAIDQDQPASNLNRGSTVITVDYQKYAHYASDDAFGIFEKKQGTLTNYQILRIGTKKQGETIRLVIAVLQPLV